MDTIWILAFSALLSNGETIGSVAGSYDELAQCNAKSPVVKEAVTKHIEQITELKVQKIEMFCIPHRFENE